MSIRARHYIVTQYWLEYFCTQHCTLCGNSGRIDTTGTKTAAGVAVGRVNFCICPNGQTMRQQATRLAKKGGARGEI